MELIGWVLTKWGNWRQSQQFWWHWPCGVCGLGREVIQNLNILVQRGLVVEVKAGCRFGDLAPWERQRWLRMLNKGQGQDLRKEPCLWNYQQRKRAIWDGGAHLKRRAAKGKDGSSRREVANSIRCGTEPFHWLWIEHQKTGCRLNGSEEEEGVVDLPSWMKLAVKGEGERLIKG